MVAEGLGKADQTYNGASLRIAIVHARWNSEIIDALVQGCVEELTKLHVKKENIVIETVPGSFELPFAVESMLSMPEKYGHIDAIIPIGVLIKGSTAHFEYIADSATKELMFLQKHVKKPIIFGILTCFTLLQAQERSGLIAGSHNHGNDWGAAAVEMATKFKRA